MADERTPAPTLKGNSRRKDGMLTTGDMARLSGNTLRTVRFYEEAGLLRPLERTDGGHRLFPGTEFDRLALVSELRAAGLSLEDIRELLEVKQRSEDGSLASRAVRERLQRQIDLMAERISVLTRLKADLESTRTVLSECEHCAEPDRYPNGCSHCSVMTEPSELPRGLSVVWSVER